MNLVSIWTLIESLEASAKDRESHNVTIMDNLVIKREVKRLN